MTPIIEFLAKAVLCFLVVLFIGALIHEMDQHG
jgi:hypothetical protein